MRIAIVGAGMSGLSCAEGLASIGHDVTLLDKGRGPGGRLATRRMDTPIGEMSFDHGAQYFTARDPGFCGAVEGWAQRGIVSRWPLPAADAWVGTPGMNAVIKAMAERQNVSWGIQVDRLERCADGWQVYAGQACIGSFDAVVLAIPAEQALTFLSLHDFIMAREVMLARSQPCWTAMFGFAERVACRRDIIRDLDVIGWACRNAAKPGRTGPEGWVVQARPEWTLAHLEAEPADIAAMLLAELSIALGTPLPQPVAAAAHRWRYAMSAGLGHGAMWNAALGLGVCGDWLLGPRIECAWLSGRHLARQVLDVPSGSEMRAAARLAN